MRSVIWMLVLAVVPTVALAEVTVTLRDDGSGGVVLEVTGAGTATGDGLSQANFQEVGDFTTLNGTDFVLATPIAVAAGMSIVGVRIDDDTSNELTLDDFFLNLDGALPGGTPYSFSGMSAVPGLSPTALNLGTYSVAALFGPFDLLTLDIVPPGVFDDVDADGVSDANDNCPTVPNADQADANGDAYGDACVAVTAFISNGASVGAGLIMGEFSRLIGAVQAGVDLSLGSNAWVVGPSALGDAVTIARNSVVLPGAGIGSDVAIGEFVIVSPNVDVGDGAVIGSQVLLLPGAALGAGATIGSRVSIGPRATIGLGARVGNNVLIGANAHVAAGAMVPSGSVIRPRSSFP